MTESLHELIEALREELRQYGEMLARLDLQQEWISTRAADELHASVQSVQEQALVLEETRMARERIQRQFAEAALRLPQATLSQLCDAVSGPRGPLLRALVDENNQLLIRVQQRARQNHLLLRRSLDTMQELVRTICPAASGSLYNVSGRTLAAPSPVLALCDAAG